MKYSNEVTPRLSAALFLAVMCFVPINAQAQYAYVANYGAGTVSVVDSQTHSVIATISTNIGPEPTGVAVTPDGGHVWVANANFGGSNGTVSVINTITNTAVQIATIIGHPEGIAISPDGKYAYVTVDNACSSTCPVDVIDTSSHSITSQIQVPNQPLGVTFNPSGSRAYIAWDNGGSANGGIAVISTTTACGATAAPCVLGNVTVQYAPEGVTVSPDGLWVYTANQNSGSISYFSSSYTTGTANNIALQAGAWPEGIAFSPDSSVVYATDNHKNVVYYFPVNNTSPAIGSIAVGAEPNGIVLAPYDAFGVPNPYGQLYVSTVSGLWIINPAINGVVNSVSISDSGPSIGNFIAPPSAASVSYVTNLGSASVSVIDNTNGNVKATITSGIGTAPTGSAVSPDLTKVIVTNQGSNSLSVIDTSTNHATAYSTGLSLNEPFGVAITPDGNTAYIANQGNNTVSVIDISGSSPSLTATITSTQFDSPVGVAITPNGNTVYVTNYYSSTVSAISTSTNAVVAGTGYPISVQTNPLGVAVDAKDGYVYVANQGSNTISKFLVGSTSATTISNASFNEPTAIAVTPDTSEVYVTNQGAGTVSIYYPGTGTITTPLGGSYPMGVGVNSDGTRAYFANNIVSGTLAPVLTNSNTAASTPYTVQSHPQAFGKFVARAPFEFFAYVTDEGSDNVKVIDTSTGLLVTTLSVGNAPIGSAISPNGAKVLVTMTCPHNPHGWSYEFIP